jgi:chromate reductase
MKPPQPVVDLKARIRAADGVLFATPEYNYSIPGVLKNAIDWASRPYGDNVWDGKPVAIMVASPSPLGTARCQYHLRQAFLNLNVIAVTRPEVMLMRT